MFHVSPIGHRAPDPDPTVTNFAVAPSRLASRRHPDTIGRMVPRELLVSVEMFSSLNSDEVDRLVEEARVISLERNQVLFREGDEAHNLYVVVNGRLAMSRASFDKRESVLALMEPGDLFGEMPMFDHRARSADAKALETSRVVEVPYEPLRDLYHSRPELLWEVVSLLANRLRSMDDALADTMFLDVAGRTAKRLLELAGDKDSFQLPITQEELAGMVGASRERVNKAISSFIRLHWLEQTDRTYRILDRAALTQRSR